MIPTYTHRAIHLESVVMCDVCCGSVSRPTVPRPVSVYSLRLVPELTRLTGRGLPLFM